MKTSLRAAAAAILITLVLISFKAPTPSLVGRWGWMSNGETQAYINFNQNGIFNVTSADSGDSVHWGNFKQVDDTLMISDSDEGCGPGYWGSYQLTFYGPDSLSMQVISDTCNGRVQGVSGGTLKRMNP
ncbi:MAG TPA: hypothetical protein VMV20_03230 [Chitinophagaceae bacterium]|nr:hypothetical protein [Chitinophagaceae bacterium]